MKKIILLIYIVIVLTLWGSIVICAKSSAKNNEKLSQNSFVQKEENIVAEVEPIVEEESGEEPIVSGEDALLISGEEDTGTSGEEQVEEEYDIPYISDSKPLLYFYNDSFIGYFKDGKWQEPEDLRLKTIFDNEFYTVYTNRYKKGKANKVMLASGIDGNGSFDYDGKILNEKYGYSLDENLGKLAISSFEGEYTYKVPNALNAELNDAYTIMLDDCEKTAVKFLADGFKYGNGDDDTSNLIAFNDDFDLKITCNTDMEVLPDSIKVFLNKYLESNDINIDIPYIIKEFYKVDLNNDGIFDEVYNITSNDNNIMEMPIEEIYGNALGEAQELLNNNGSFSIIFTVINDTINVLEESHVSLTQVEEQEGWLGTTEKYSLVITDLNNDDLCEILYHASGWEYWWDVLAIYDNYEYKNVSELYNNNIDRFSGKKFVAKINDENLENSKYEMTVKFEAAEYNKGTFTATNGWGSTFTGSYYVKNGRINCKVEHIEDKSTGISTDNIFGRMTFAVLEGDNIAVIDTTPWRINDEKLKKDVSCFEKGIVLKITK